MYFRKREASVAVVTLVACLVMSFVQPIFADGCPSDHCTSPSSSTSTSTEPTCPTNAVDVIEYVTFTTIDERSVTIRWNVVNSPCSVQSVCVQYKLYQRGACPSLLPNTEYIKLPDMNIIRNTASINNLEPYTSYDVRIVAKCNASDPAQVVQRRVRTNRSAPQKPRNLRIRRSSRFQLTFEWDVLTCNDINGAFRYYIAVIENTNRPASLLWQKYVYGSNTSSVTFTRLEPCTVYNLSLTAVNFWSQTNGPYPRSPTTWSLGTTTGSLFGGGIGQRGVSSLSVYWSVPWPCHSSMFNYNLTYERSGLLACSNYSITPDLISVPLIRRTSFHITNLQPFTNYTIRISIIGAPDGDRLISGSTMPSDPGVVSYLNVRTTGQDRDEYQFYWWRSGCKELHGNFSCYKYIFFRGNDSVAGYVDSRHCTLETQKTYRIDELQACTVYRFEVQVVTYTDGLFVYSDGIYRRSQWKSIDVQTPTRAPGVPRNVTAHPNLQPVSDMSEARVSWEAPIDNPCKPAGYYITYQLLYEDMCKRPSVDELVDTEFVDHPANHSTIRGLLPYSVYRVCVRGWNMEGDGLPVCVNLTTGVDAPSNTPKRVKCTKSTYDSLTFTWEKPGCGDRNGPISQYEYRLNALYGSSKPRRGNVTGNEDGGAVTLTNLIPATTYLFEVRAYNEGDLFGSYAQAEQTNTSIAIYHPPRKVVATSLNETTASIEWFAPLSEINITGYRIVYWQSGLKENTSVILHEADVCGSSCVMEETITGLKPATNHSIQVIAEYEHGEEESNVLEFRTPEEVRASSPRQSVVMPVLVCISLIIFVLLLVIAALLYSRKTDKKLCSSEWFPFSLPDIQNPVRSTGTALSKSTHLSNSRNSNHAERKRNGGGLEMEITGTGDIHEITT